jgi:hypothetical protein
VRRNVKTKTSGRVTSTSQRPLPDNTQQSLETNIREGFEPAIPSSERPQTHTLDCAAAKPISVTYSECVFVSLVIQHVKRMRRFILPCVACPAVPYFSTLSRKRHDYREKIVERKMCVWFSLNVSETFFLLRRIQRDIVINVQRPSCKVPVILVRF